jgi:histidyl-tRNA synthetase
LIVGETEINQNAAILRNMTTKDQDSIDIDTLIPELIKIIK